MAVRKVNPIVAELQIPEGFTTRKVEGVLQVVRQRKSVIVKEKKPMKIERTLRPYGCRSHEMQVGRMVDGEFKAERGLWNVTKDSRLKVSRKYEGKGAQTDVHYAVDVPANYPLFIVLKEKHMNNTTSPDYSYEVLYTPVA